MATKIQVTISQDKEHGGTDVGMLEAFHALLACGVLPTSGLVLTVECGDQHRESIRDTLAVAMTDRPIGIDVKIKTTISEEIERRRMERVWWEKVQDLLADRRGRGVEPPQPRQPGPRGALVSRTPRILGLDASSTTIGYVVLEGRTATASGNVLLPEGLISVRCLHAQRVVFALLDRHTPDAVAIESPVVKRFKGKQGQRVDTASAVIPQARVSGAILAVVAARGLVWQEVAPASGKKALAGHGAADKAMMETFARAYGVTGEHAADALGVALAIAEAVTVEASHV